MEYRYHCLRFEQGWINAGFENSTLTTDRYGVKLQKIVDYFTIYLARRGLNLQNKNLKQSGTLEIQSAKGILL